MNDHDPLEEYQYSGRMEIWDWGSHQFVEPGAMMVHRAHRALAILCLVRGFDWVDILLIAQVAAGSKEYAEALIDKLEEETGIRCWLTSRQWSVISLEIEGRT